MVGYIQDAAASAGDPHAVVDTRGPCWDWLGSPWRLTSSIAVLAWSRVVAPARIHHIHVAGRGSTARKLFLTAVARGLGCSHVLHLHDYDYATELASRRPWVRSQIRRMFRGANLVIVLGGRDLALVERQLEVPAERIVVMPNSVPDPGPPTGGHGSARPGEPVTILFLGRLSERKGVPELLCALAQPVMSGLPWRAILAGDGPIEAYREEIQRLGLEGRVTLPGWLGEGDIRELCAGADILVLPSHAEGMAMSVIEGLSHGLAVVTTRVGAHEEVLTDGVTGLFVAVGDVGALADRLASLVGDHRRRQLLARNARSLFQERFNMAGYLRRLEDLYRGLGTRPTEAISAE